MKNCEQKSEEQKLKKTLKCGEKSKMFGYKKSSSNFDIDKTFQNI